MEEKLRHRPESTDVSLKTAAVRLGVSEARVRQLGDQGRLEQRNGSDGEWRYTFKSVLHLRMEDLIRPIMETVRKKCPELEEKIEELAAVQFGRGRIVGQEDLYMLVMPDIQETFDKIEKSADDTLAKIRKSS